MVPYLMLYGALRWLQGPRRLLRGSIVDIWGANELIWPTGFIIDATPDASQTFTKSGGLKGHLKGV